MTDPIDLDELERQLKWLEGSPPGDTRQASLRRVEKQKRLLWENRTALLAAARRLRELEGALEFLDAHSSLIDSRDDDRVYEPSRTLEMARDLGWKGTP